MDFWIARDTCGYSQLYVEEPIKRDGYFECVPTLDGLLLVIDYFQK